MGGGGAQGEDNDPQGLQRLYQQMLRQILPERQVSKIEHHWIAG